MSKEALEKIKKAEKHAKALTERAEAEGAELERRTREKISAERKHFSEKLRAERNERLRLCGLRLKQMEETANAEAKKASSEASEKYKSLHDAAVTAAMRVILG